MLSSHCESVKIRTDLPGLIEILLVIILVLKLKLVDQKVLYKINTCLILKDLSKMNHTKMTNELL